MRSSRRRRATAICTRRSCGASRIRRRCKLTYWFEEAGGVVGAGSGSRSCASITTRGSSRPSAGRDRTSPHKLRELARSSGAELDRRWRINMMLNKWLDYLFEVGHSLNGKNEPLISAR